MSGEPLSVDGPRPSVAWVSSLPRKWTRGIERLLLFVLASDAYGNETAVSRTQLASWAGVWNGDVDKALRALTEPTSERPALIVRKVGVGRGNRTKYRLRTELDPSKVAGESRLVSQEKKPPGDPGHIPALKAAGESGRGKWPEKAAGESPATPFPSLPSRHASHVGSERETPDWSALLPPMP